jgi:hypothetical protein
MYLVYKYVATGADELVGYAHSKVEFKNFCAKKGLTQIRKGEDRYGKEASCGYYKDVYYIVKVKAIAN